MKVFDANISVHVLDYLHNELSQVTLFNYANKQLLDTCGIRNFFADQNEFDIFRQTISNTHLLVSEPDRSEYGDFQTNMKLAQSVTEFLYEKGINPKLVIEPTCGKGNFIVAALGTFIETEFVIGVEIYKPYSWETKFNILQFFIDNPREKKPDIEIYNFNIFEFDFIQIAKQYSNYETLIIGNPPWVTNSKLSTLNSENLPKKSNFKNHSGLDAITGKGNFDIGEFITLKMLDSFENTKGHFAFLVKNAVIKNILFDQKKRKYKISNIQKCKIDSKSEFNVSVEAALFSCRLNSNPEYTCKEYDFYDNQHEVSEFGWIGDKFVSNIELYKHSSDIDGLCPFMWRQGVKHDMSSIMEFEKRNGHYINGLQQEIKIEEDLVYGLLKSSDLKHPLIDKTRKFTIITQKKVGQDTSYIRNKHPKTYDYLESNKDLFNQRKSSIYNNKPSFSIFGIGDYSFAPFKIAISGLYKTFSFSLILPIEQKPVMVDDTCYILGFDDLDFAAYCLILLNSDKTRELLQAITFSDSKRTFTKEILMRIDLYKLAIQFSSQCLKDEINQLNNSYNLNLSPDKWDDFVKSMKPSEKVAQLDFLT
jgi:hypothetical protein